MAQVDTVSNFMHPGISSAVLHKGHFEMRLTGSYGTFYDNSEVAPDHIMALQDQKFAYFASSGLYGISKWLNLGIIYQFMHVQDNYLVIQTPFVSRYNTNKIGPQARIKLFNHNNRTEGYLQSYVLFPLDNYISSDKITYAGQLITTTRVGYKWVFSLQLSANIYPKYEDERHPISFSPSFFAGYLVKTRFMPYLIASYNSDLRSTPEAGYNRYYQLNYAIYTGIGAKYQIFRNLDFAAYYLYTVKSKNNDRFKSLFASMLILF